MADLFQLPENPRLAKAVLETQSESERHRRELGRLGELFGAQPATYLVALMALLLVVSGVAYTFLNAHSEFAPLEFWKAIGPLVGTLAGYLMGAGAKRNKLRK